MKIVLDTNVLIAALIARGVCHELFEHCVLRHSVFTSEFILSETHEKLTDKFGYSVELAVATLSVLRTRLEVVTPATFERQVCRDPDDDNILGTAVAGKCDCIITGDEDLLILKRYKGMDILRPREFLTEERTD